MLARTLVALVDFSPGLFASELLLLKVVITKGQIGSLVYDIRCEATVRECSRWVSDTYGSAHEGTIKWRYQLRFDAENMSMIQREPGKGFASHGMTSTKSYYDIPILHQGVVTI